MYRHSAPSYHSAPYQPKYYSYKPLEDIVLEEAEVIVAEADEVIEVWTWNKMYLVI